MLHHTVFRCLTTVDVHHVGSVITWRDHELLAKFNENLSTDSEDDRGLYSHGHGVVQKSR
jgi:hypothetical protein